MRGNIDWPTQDIRALQRLKRRKRKEYCRLFADETTRAQAGKLMTPARAKQLLTYHDSYSRLSEIMRFSDIMSWRSWLRLLGEEWTTLDNLFAWHATLRRLLPGRVTWLLMNEDERAAWRALPNVVTIYRGCSEVNMDGLSWSLCPEIAAKFPALMRYARPAGQRALLMTGQVTKSRITAVKLDRSEQEIIALNVRQVASHPLK